MAHIVDTTAIFDCPHSGENYFLIVRSALIVPYMDHNLIPPFAMREEGVDVKLRLSARTPRKKII